jgi:hypothetical protein
MVKNGHVREGGMLKIRHSSACMAMEAMCITHMSDRACGFIISITKQRACLFVLQFLPMCY